MIRPIDLHIHSRFSQDGEYSPAQLVAMCAEVGITQMAITDHNSVAGVDEAIAAAEKLGIQCLPGIEIDCTHEGKNFHVLGYQIDHKHQDFQDIEDKIRQQSIETSRKQLQLFRAIGLELSEKELMAATENNYWGDSWTGEAFAQVLFSSKNPANQAFVRPYREGGARADNPFVNFYFDYCVQGKPCYVPLVFPSMTDIIDLIHRNGGFAVLAHPAVNLKGQFSAIDGLIPLGLDGIEVYSSYHDEATAQWFAKKAEEHHLRATCGSDFHGKIKPFVSLGHCEKPQ